MPLWGRNDQANNAPKYRIEAGQDLRGNTAFGNTTVTGGRSVGVYGVDKTEASLSDMTAHPGWVVVRTGTGPVAELTVVAGGTGYVNGAVGSVTGGTDAASYTVSTNSTGGIVSAVISDAGGGFVGGTGTMVLPANGIATVTVDTAGEDYSNDDLVIFSNGAVDAVGLVVTDGNGAITAVNLITAGRGFSNTDNTVVDIETDEGTDAVLEFTIGAGSGANVTFTLGGRAGRRTAETLVAMGSITGDANDDTIFPDS